jgi:hypothetical protein
MGEGGGGVPSWAERREKKFGEIILFIVTLDFFLILRCIVGEANSDKKLPRAPSPPPPTNEGGGQKGRRGLGRRERE